MTLTVKKILISIISFILSLCVMFSIIAFLTNDFNFAFAQGSSKSIVEWNATESVGVDNIINDDGTVTVINKFAPVGNVIGDYNPYKNIIKKNILINNLDNYYDGYDTGISFSAQFDFPNEHPLKNNSNNTLVGPRIRLFKEYFLIANGDSDSQTYLTYFYKNNAYNQDVDYEAEDDVYYLKQDVPYTIYFGVENVKNGDVVTAYQIYIKVASYDEQSVYIDKTFDIVTTENMTSDISDYAYLVVHSGASPDSVDLKFQEYPSVSSHKTLFLDALENDEDISYYWDSNSILQDSIGKNATEKYATVLHKDDAFYTPDFDNRFTFKLSVNNFYGYFTSEFFTAYESGRVFDCKAGGVYIGLGQRDSDYAFIFDYYRDEITLVTSLSTLGSKTVAFDLDHQKDYKVSIVIRDVRNDQGILVYRMPVVDVVEIGNDEHNITASVLTDFLVEYADQVGDYFPKHFRMANGNGHYGIVKSNLCETSEGCGFTVSAFEPWKDVTIIDGESSITKKLNTAKLELPIGNGSGVFGGYSCNADNKIYLAGCANLSSYNGKTITFTAKYLVKVTIKDIDGDNISNNNAVGYFTLPNYDGQKTFIAYKATDGKLYKEGDTVEIFDTTEFTLIDADVQILDDVKIRLSDDQFGGLRFAVKILTADLNALQSANVAFKLTIDGVEVQLASPVQDGAYTIAYFAKTDIAFAKFNTDIDAKIIISYESGDVAVLTASANICEIASDLASRNDIAIANGQALYNKTAAQMLQKYLSALED